MALRNVLKRSLVNVTSKYDFKFYLVPFLLSSMLCNCKGGAANFKTMYSFHCLRLNIECFCRLLSQTRGPLTLKRPPVSKSHSFNYSIRTQIDNLCLSQTNDPSYWSPFGPKKEGKFKLSSKRSTRKCSMLNHLNCCAM